MPCWCRCWWRRILVNRITVARIVAFVTYYLWGKLASIVTRPFRHNEKKRGMFDKDR